jgi:hypothetical protein
MERLISPNLEVRVDRRGRHWELEDGIHLLIFTMDAIRRNLTSLMENMEN